MKEVSPRETQTTWLHFYEMLRTGKSMKTEAGSTAVRDGRESVCFQWSNKNFILSTKSLIQAGLEPPDSERRIPNLLLRSPEYWDYRLMLEIKPRALCRPGEHCTSWATPHPKRWNVPKTGVLGWLCKCEGFWKLLRVGAIAQGLRALAAPAEDLSLSGAHNCL